MNLIAWYHYLRRESIKKCANSNKKVLTNVLTRLNIVLTATMSVARKAGDKSDRG